MKALPAAALVAGAAFACALLQPIGASASPSDPGVVPPGGSRSLDLTVVPMTIDEPGTYVVRHDWDLGDAAESWGTEITVLADKVTIDFDGHQIMASHTGTIIKIKGIDVTLRGGFLAGGPQAYAIRSSGRRTVLDHMSIYSHDGLPLSGAGTVVRDSDLYGRVGALVVNDDAIVEHNVINCFADCVYLGNNDRFERNRVRPFTEDVVTVRGDHNVLADNTLEAGAPGEIFTSFVITGNQNSLLRNTVLHGAIRAVISVDGTGNTLDGNVAPPTAECSSAVGIRFMQGGNYYGNNRMAAQTPFATGGVAQTDWGGNVGY